MRSLLVSPKNQKELQLIQELLNKMNINNKILSTEDKEDLGMGVLMKDVNKNKRVSRSAIMKKLS